MKPATVEQNNQVVWMHPESRTIKVVVEFPETVTKCVLGEGE